MALLLPRAFVMLIALAALGAAASACAGGSAQTEALVTIEPLASSTPRTIVAADAEPSPTAAPEIETPPQASGDGEVASEPAPVVVGTAVPDGAPSAGRWIDVDVTHFIVRLMDGEHVVREIGPVGIGTEIDTGNYLSTQTGLFYVHTKIEELAYDAPFDTYISHWVGFDTAKDNGFHSFLKDASGAVVDASTGRVSNGCIRSGEADAIFAFAEIGMPVYVHV